jgi:hypothetical protein
VTEGAADEKGNPGVGKIKPVTFEVKHHHFFRDKYSLLSLQSIDISMVMVVNALDELKDTEPPVCNPLRVGTARRTDSSNQVLCYWWTRGLDQGWFPTSALQGIDRYLSRLYSIQPASISDDIKFPLWAARPTTRAQKMAEHRQLARRPGHREGAYVFGREEVRP